MKLFKNKTFMSLAILLAIALIAGALLAVFHDLLFVTEEERRARSFAKIYGEPVKATQLELPSEQLTYENGEVLAVYLVEDGNYLLESKGKGGYKGTVTVWTIFECSGSAAEGDLVWEGIGKVVYGSDENESLIKNIDEKYYLSFGDYDAQLRDGKLFTVQKGGDGLYAVYPNVTRTSTAIVNAVNTAVLCFREHILTGGAA